MNILVSACLIGLNTRYSGDGKRVEWIERLSNAHTLIPVCPEQLGGLPTPRPPCELRDDRAVTRSGMDYTLNFVVGAEAALRIAKLNHCPFAILKQRSPSCGNGEIYDGTFSGARTSGDGMTTRLLKGAGIRIFSESDEINILQLLTE